MTRAAVALLALAALLASGCGDDDADDATELAGAWFACADEACEALARDGFELDGGRFTRLRLESGDADDARYCEIPFGTFEYANGTLHLMPGSSQASQDSPREVAFRVDGDRATLTDEAGAPAHYVRVSGESSGACAGVLDS